MPDKCKTCFLKDNDMACTDDMKRQDSCDQYVDDRRNLCGTCRREFAICVGNPIFNVKSETKDNVVMCTGWLERK